MQGTAELYKYNWPPAHVRHAAAAHEDSPGVAWEPAVLGGGGAAGRDVRRTRHRHHVVHVSAGVGVRGVYAVAAHREHVLAQRQFRQAAGAAHYALLQAITERQLENQFDLRIGSKSPFHW